MIIVEVGGGLIVFLDSNWIYWLNFRVNHIKEEERIKGYMTNAMKDLKNEKDHEIAQLREDLKRVFEQKNQAEIQLANMRNLFAK